MPEDGATPTYDPVLNKQKLGTQSQEADVRVWSQRFRLDGRYHQWRFRLPKRQQERIYH